MLLKSIKLGIGILAAMLICGEASAQFFGGGSGYAAAAYGGAGGFGGGGFGGYSNYGALGGAGVVGDNCGREITYGQAASLWAGYCTESCGYYGGNAGGSSFGAVSSCGASSCGGGVSYGAVSYAAPSCDVAPVSAGRSGCKLFGGGCRLFSGGKLRGLFGGGCLAKHGGGGCGGCGGCDQGGFGYPSDCCCCGDGNAIVGGYGGGYGGLSYGASDCNTGVVSGGHGGCKLFGGGGGCRLFGGGGRPSCGLKGRGTGLLSRLFNSHAGGGGGCCLSRNRAPSYSVNYVPVTFQASASQCGSNNAYFNEFIGPEYGTTGMQSSVSGCATGACGGGVSYNTGFDLGGAADMSYGGGYSQGAEAVDFGQQSFGQQSYGAGADFGMGQSVGGQVQNIVGQAITDAVQGAGN